MDSQLEYCRISSTWKPSDAVKNYVRYQLEESDDELNADFGSLPEECVAFVNSASTTPQLNNKSEEESGPSSSDPIVNEENPLNSCVFDIEMTELTHTLLAVDILCTARYMEVYGSSGMYIETVKGTSVETTADGQEIYLLQHSFEAALARCRVKLCRIQRSDRLLVRCFLLTLGKAPSAPLASLIPGILPGAHLDMAKVRSLMSDSGKQVSPQAQQLMSSLEHFQQAASGGGQFGGGMSTMAMLSTLMAGMGKMSQSPMSSLAVPMHVSNVTTNHISDSNPSAASNDGSNGAVHSRSELIPEGAEGLHTIDDPLIGNASSHVEASLLPSKSDLKRSVVPVSQQDLDAFEKRLYENIERQLADFEQRLISKLDSMAITMATALLNK